MQSSNIATGIVVYASKGFAAIQAELTKFQAKLKSVGEGLQKLGGQRNFAVMTASITGLVAAADPVRFRNFTASLQILSMQVGRIFIPLLKDATRWVDQLAAYFRKLTDEQRMQILHWVKIALAGAAFVMVATKIVGVLGAVGNALPVLSAGVKAVGMAFNSLGKAGGPVGAILLVLGLIAGVLTLVEAKTGFISKIFDKWGGLLEPLQPFFDKISAAVGELFDKMGPAIEKVAASVMGLIEAVAPAYVAMGKVYADIFKPVLKIVGIILPLYMKFQAIIMTVLAKVLSVVAGIVTPIAALFDKLWKFVEPLFEMWEKGFSAVQDLFGELWNMIRPAFDWWEKAADTVMKVLLDGLGEAMKTAEDLFTFIGQLVQMLAQKILAIFQMLKAARKELLDNTMLGRGAKFIGQKTGLMDKEGNGILDKPIEDALKGIIDFKPGAKKDKDGKAKKDGSDFASKAVVQAPQFVGISEMFKKVQQSAVEDPNLRVNREHMEISKKNSDYLANIDKNTKNQEPAGLGY
jgi:hypothetical protein